MLITRDIPNVEILSVGSWHGMGCPPAGCAFTTADLDAIVLASEADAPIKLGHTERQKILQEEGMPAAGWVTNLRRVGDKIVADLKAVPRKIADLIDAGAYRNRSVELAGTGAKTFISALALLGAELPAVENLADITALYSNAQLALDEDTRVVMFTAEPPSKPATPTFAEEGEAVIADLAAFTTRAKSRAAFRSAEGRTLSMDNRELLARLAASADAARAELETLSREEPGDPANDQDYRSAMRAALMNAQTSMAALVGG